MNAVVSQFVNSKFEWKPKTKLRGEARRAPEILHEVFRRRTAVPRTRRTTITGGRRTETTGIPARMPWETACDILVQVGEPEVLRRDILQQAEEQGPGAQSEHTVFEALDSASGASAASEPSADLGYDGPAPYAWVGMLICLATAALSATGIVLMLT